MQHKDSYGRIVSLLLPKTKLGNWGRQWQGRNLATFFPSPTGMTTPDWNNPSLRCSPSDKDPTGGE